MFSLVFRRRRRRRRRQDIGDGRQRQTVPERRDQRQHDVDDDHVELERVVHHAGDPQPVAVEPEETSADQRDRRQRPGHSEPRLQRHVAHPVAERQREEGPHTDAEHGRVNARDIDDSVTEHASPDAVIDRIRAAANGVCRVDEIRTRTPYRRRMFSALGIVSHRTRSVTAA